jgi:23S rRNA (pseudouridine1915-N3)-methyltransferase
MNITIIYVGQKTSDYDDHIAEYTKRITKPFVLKTIRIKPAGLDKASSVAREESLIQSELVSMRDTTIIILDEKGDSLTTVAFSRILEKSVTNGSDIAFVIGGSYGLSDEYKARYRSIKLSDMTLPHEMARLILTEQIYRAIDIIGGGKYHHE